MCPNTLCFTSLYKFYILPDIIRTPSVHIPTHFFHFMFTSFTKSFMVLNNARGCCSELRHTITKSNIGNYMSVFIIIKLNWKEFVTQLPEKPMLYIFSYMTNSTVISILYMNCNCLIKLSLNIDSTILIAAGKISTSPVVYFI